jgi:predicted SAM-dependent methyltransferase
MTMTTEPDLEKLFEAKRGIQLDIGCGNDRQEGFVGMDRIPFPGVEIVHDWDDIPWPIPDESCLRIIASHVVEHVDPARGHFLDWMAECWRILKVEGQLAIAYPYGGSRQYLQDPTHVNPCIENTWFYWDPAHDSGFHMYYELPPFKIEYNGFSRAGHGEVLLRKLDDKVEYHSDGKLHYGKGKVR